MILFKCCVKAQGNVLCVIGECNEGYTLNCLQQRLTVHKVLSEGFSVDQVVVVLNIL